MQPFLDDEEIWDFINQAQPTKEAVHAVVEKSLNKNRLSLAETALLLNATDPELIELIKQGARTLKERVYGKRIVLFARFMWAIIAPTIAGIVGSRLPTPQQ